MNPESTVVLNAVEYVTKAEYDSLNSRIESYQAKVSNNSTRVDSLKEIIIEAYPESDDQETLGQIAELFDIELTKQVDFTATITVSGTMTVDLSNYNDYTIEEVLNDTLNVSAYGVVDIHDHSIDSAEEC